MHASILPHNPPDPADAVRSYEGCKARAEQMLREAKTFEDRQVAQFWIDNAERQLTRWLMVLSREVGR